MSLEPRAVVVSRASEYEELLALHGTYGQAEFFLKTHNQDIKEIFQRHERLLAAHHSVLSQIPTKWRRSVIKRSDLSRFLFEPEDVIICVGQDGLVANSAKYLNGQPVIGINPDPSLFQGVLTRFSPEDTLDLLQGAVSNSVSFERRTMVRVSLDDGLELISLNEIFLGHRSHQSARYLINYDHQEEFQSSSGIIVASGTGATGWGRSIHLAHHSPLALPTPEEERLSYFVREAFPSISTGVGLVEGIVETPGHELKIISQMNNGGVCFGDGIEEDFLDFDFGKIATVTPAQKKLLLVSG
jgi:NAD kinase